MPFIPNPETPFIIPKSSESRVMAARTAIWCKKRLLIRCLLVKAWCADVTGYIKLQLPVFHVGYFKSTLQTLQCICKSCSRVLLPDEDRQRMLRLFRSPRMERMQRAGLFKRVIDKCKRTRFCSFCGDVNGTVKCVTRKTQLGCCCCSNLS